MQWLYTKIGLFYAKLLSYLSLNIIYFLFNRVYAYRKTVIDLNLINAFPHKRSEELWYIRSNYYRHLADFIAETIKSISISKKELKERIQLHLLLRPGDRHPPAGRRGVDDDQIGRAHV